MRGICEPLWNPPSDSPDGNDCRGRIPAFVHATPSPVAIWILGHIVEINRDKVRFQIGSHTCGPANVAINIGWCVPVFMLVGWWYRILPSGVLHTLRISTCNRGDMRVNLIPPTNISHGTAAHFGRSVFTGGG